MVAEIAPNRCRGHLFGAVGRRQVSMVNGPWIASWVSRLA